MRYIAFVLISMACASLGRRVHGTPSSSPEEGNQAISSLKAFATLLSAFNPTGVGHGHRTAKHPTADPGFSGRLSDVQALFDGLGGGKKVVVAGACSQTGQVVARTLADSFQVTALCRPQTAAKVKDDTGPFTDSKARFVDFGSSAAADAVVVATDEAPSTEAVSEFFSSLREQGVPHVVYLSRIGASKGGFGPIGAWKDAEQAALKAYGEDGLTIVRLGSPLTAGPYFANEPETGKWAAAKAIDGYRTLEVQAGDELKQGGLGSPRAAAAMAIASALRRGPEQQASSFSVVAETSQADKPATTQAQLDAMFEEAGGPVAAKGGSTATLNLDLEKQLFRPFTLRALPKTPSLQDLFFGPPAVSGGYWGTVFIFIWGIYITTTPEYVAKSGINLWGIDV